MPRSHLSSSSRSGRGTKVHYNEKQREQASQTGGGERTGLVGGGANLELKEGPPVDLELVLLLLAKQSGLLRQLLHSSASSLLLLRGGHDDDDGCWVCLFVVSKVLLFHYVVLYSGGRACRAQLSRRARRSSADTWPEARAL